MRKRTGLAVFVLTGMLFCLAGLAEDGRPARRVGILSAMENEVRLLLSEAEIERESLAVFAEKSERFERLCAGDAPEAYLRRRIAEAAPVQAELFTPSERLDAVRELAGQICPLPQGKTPPGSAWRSRRTVPI